jgi:hypothetical protein
MIGHLQASENDVTVMISNRYFENKINEWNSSNKLEPGSQRLKEWGEQADEFARNRVREFRYRP